LQTRTRSVLTVARDTVDPVAMLDRDDRGHESRQERLTARELV
jgi:hypothetical protein